MVDLDFLYFTLIFPTLTYPPSGHGPSSRRKRPPSSFETVEGLTSPLFSQIPGFVLLPNRSIKSGCRVGVDLSGHLTSVSHRLPNTIDLPTEQEGDRKLIQTGKRKTKGK